MSENEKIVLDLIAKHDGVLDKQTLLLVTALLSKHYAVAVAELKKRDYIVDLKIQQDNETILVMKRAGWDAYNNDETL